MGKPDAEHGTRGPVLDPDPAAMGLDRDLAERQAEPAIARSATGLEPGEHLEALILRDSKTCVADPPLARDGELILNAAILSGSMLADGSTCDAAWS